MGEFERGDPVTLVDSGEVATFLRFVGNGHFAQVAIQTKRWGELQVHPDDIAPAPKLVRPS